MAEDNTDVCDFVERVLSSVGYSVISAVNGKEAIDIFDANKDKIEPAPYGQKPLFSTVIA